MSVTPSKELEKQIATRAFDEVYEVVRVFTVWNQDPRVKVRVTVSRYYMPGGLQHHLSYEREDDQGEWHEASYGQVLTGAEDEESTIRTAISFIREVHKLGY